MANSKAGSSLPLKGRIAEARERLYRVAFAWCSDEMLADDLVQETITAGIANARQLRDENQLFAWLYSILRNNWYRHLRKAKSQAPLDEQLPCDDYGPLHTCQELEIVNKVRRAVAALPIEQRQVISLVDLDQLSYCEVASVLQIPIGTVMSRLHRARKNLLARLDREANSKKRIRIVE